MQKKIKIILKYILFFCFMFLYKECYALKNINQSIELYKKKYIIIKYKSDIIKYDDYHNKSYLIGNASINYNNILIKANYIEINWQKNTIYANYKYNQFIYQHNVFLKKVLIINHHKKYYCDNFFFNLNTQVGIGNNFLYEENNGMILTKSIKKNKNFFLMKEAFYTNDTYFKNKKDYLSDYFFKTKFIKHVNNKFLITGPILMYLYQIPTPIFIPFSYTYTNNKSNSKILIPHFGRKNNNDFFIENLGFFAHISNNWNIRIAGSIYHRNSWRIDTKTRYNFKYQSSGIIDINYQKFFKKQSSSHKYKINHNIYEIKWNHIAKNKNKKITYFANLNYINNKNNYKDKINIINHSLNSNISSFSLKKNFDKIPLTLIINNKLNHDFNKKYINMYCPNITLTLDKISPFKNKKGTFLKNIDIDYNMNIKNIMNYDDKYFFSKKMFEIMRINFEQHLLINTKTYLFKYFTITNNIIYNENIQLLINKNYQNIFFKKKFINIINKKLKIFREFKLGVNLFFTLYGLKTFQKNPFIKALRHKIDTEIEYSLYPIITKNYYNFLYDTIDDYISFQKIKFSFSNNLKAKIINNNNNYKIINLIDNFNIFTTYDISKNIWNDIIFNGNTSIKNLIFDISGRLCINKNNKLFNNLDNKILNINEYRMLKYCWIAIGYRLNNFIYKTAYYNTYKKKGAIRYENFFFDDNNYAHYKIFWNLNLKFNYNYNNFLLNNVIYKNLLLKIDGDIYPTPFWKIGINLDYDIFNKKIINTLFIFDRNLRSFKIKFIWSTNNIWYFYFGINDKFF